MITNINMKKFKNNLARLSKISDTESGITRISFTQTYFKGRDFVRNLMDEVGLKTTVDSVGNLIGTWGGQDLDKPAISIGSHIDTVPNGGKYDGTIGVLGGIEVIRSLKKMDYSPKYPIEVIAFINEEGSAPVDIGGVFGSRAMMGSIDIDKDLEKELSRINLKKEDVINSYRESNQFNCYLEMHIEQASVLEKNNLSIGIVTGIVGCWKFLANIYGTASHAGTTPMGNRDDALLKSIPIIQSVNQIAKQGGEGMVGTVGGLIVNPGVVNVIPGEVILKLEFRNINKARLENAVEELNDEIKLIKGATLKNLTKPDPVLLDEVLEKRISEICDTSGIKYVKMPSFAGHDAREMARKIHTAMIFVPSKDGISHSPEEYTSDDDIMKGITVLLETVIKIDQE